MRLTRWRKADLKLLAGLKGAPRWMKEFAEIPILDMGIFGHAGATALARAWLRERGVDVRSYRADWGWYAWEGSGGDGRAATERSAILGAVRAILENEKGKS